MTSLKLLRDIYYHIHRQISFQKFSREFFKVQGVAPKEDSVTVSNIRIPTNSFVRLKFHWNLFCPIR